MLMDIRLKGQMDGIEAAELIRSRLGIDVALVYNQNKQKSEHGSCFFKRVKEDEIKVVEKTTRDL